MELLDRPDRRRGRGAPLPRRGRPGQPRAAARVPLRHGAADRRGFEPPVGIPAWGVLRSVTSRHAGTTAPAGRGALYYRAHETSGNTAFAHALADAVDATGEAVGVPVFCGVAALRARRAATTRSAPSTRWSSRCSPPAARTPAGASAGGDDEAWDVERLAALDIPVLQGLCLTSEPRRVGGLRRRASRRSTRPTRSRSRSSTGGSSPRRSRSRRSTHDGLPRYVADPERCARVAGIAVNHARLRHIPTGGAQDRAGAVGLPHQALPGRQRRRPGHPGLRDPAAARACARRATTSARPGRRDRSSPRDGDDDTDAGDALIHALIAAAARTRSG